LDRMPSADVDVEPGVLPTEQPREDDILVVLRVRDHPSARGPASRPLRAEKRERTCRYTRRGSALYRQSFVWRIAWSSSSASTRRSDSRYARARAASAATRAWASSSSSSVMRVA